MRMKKLQPTTIVTLRLPPDIVAAMKVAAESDERSLSFIALKWLRLGQNAATAISAPAPAAPDVPAPPPKATPRVKPKPAQRQEKAPDGWWQELRMVNGKPGDWHIQGRSCHIAARRTGLKWQ